jgi:two-component system response regulator CpxR
MAIVSIFSGSYCHGEEIADGVADELGYARVDAELLKVASRSSGVSAPKLESVMYGSPPFLNRLTHEREKNLAYLRAGLAELAQRDDVVYHGFAGVLFPRNISHILQVCAIANLEYRIGIACEEEGLSRAEAQKEIGAGDARRARWTRWVLGQEPYVGSVYDVVLAMHSTTVDEAIRVIVESVGKPGLSTTESSLQAARDFLLAARVNIVLVGNGHDVEVTAEHGNVRIGINKYAMFRERLEKKLTALAKEVPDVESVTCGPGSRYVPPGLLPEPDFDPPFRTLLVDDEQEFVQTLSERLQARNLISDVVYDGEEALEALTDEPPEVMVLDLKMPGIGGIEVLRRVKRDHPNIEVIILTGHGSDREERLAAELGAFAYLRKPVDIDVLAATMRGAYRKIGKVGPGEEKD